MTIAANLVTTLINRWKAESGFTGIDRIILYPQSMSSESSKSLQQALKLKIEQTPELSNLRVLRVKSAGEYVPTANDLIINFGNKTNPSWFGSVKSFFINSIEGVKNSIDKLKTFQVLSSDPTIKTLEWTTDINVAREWLDTSRVYCRTLISSSGGDGIVVASNNSELVQAPLYTKGINVSKEFRLHIFQNECIDVTQKRRRITEDDTVPEHSDVRNLDNGYVFCHENVSVPSEVKDMCIKAVKLLKLDIAAIDLIKTSSGKYLIVESNSNCGKKLNDDGTVGTTLAAYRDAVLNLVSQCNSL